MVTIVHFICSYFREEVLVLLPLRGGIISWWFLGVFYWWWYFGSATLPTRISDIRENVSLIYVEICVLSWLIWVLVLYLAKILSLFYGSTEIYIICMELLRRYGKVCARIFSQILLLAKDRCKVKRTTMIMASNSSLMDLNASSADGCWVNRQSWEICWSPTICNCNSWGCRPHSSLLSLPSSRQYREEIRRQPTLNVEGTLEVH